MRRHVFGGVDSTDELARAEGRPVSGESPSEHHPRTPRRLKADSSRNLLSPFEKGKPFQDSRNWSGELRRLKMPRRTAGHSNAQSSITESRTSNEASAIHKVRTEGRSRSRIFGKQVKSNPTAYSSNSQNCAKQSELRRWSRSLRRSCSRASRSLLTNVDLFTLSFNTRTPVKRSRGPPTSLYHSGASPG